MMLSYSDGDEKKGSAEHFCKYCIIPKLNEIKSPKAAVFDFSDMDLSPSVQMTYIIAYYLVRECGLTSNAIVNRVILKNDHDPVIGNLFIRAVFEATKEIPVVKGDSYD